MTRDEAIALARKHYEAEFGMLKQPARGEWVWPDYVIAAILEAAQYDTPILSQLVVAWDAAQERIRVLELAAAVKDPNEQSLLDEYYDGLDRIRELEEANEQLRKIAAHVPAMDYLKAKEAAGFGIVVRALAKAKP